MGSDTMISVKIKYSPTEYIYRTLDFLDSDEADKQMYTLVFKYSNISQCFLGCSIDKENENFGFEVRNNDDIVEMINVIVLQDIPEFCSSSVPILLSIFRGNLYSFYPSCDFEIFNVCGKIITQQRGCADDMFKPEYLPCLIKNREHVVNFSHLHGNLKHKRMKNIIVFRGFKSLNRFNAVIKEVLNGYILQSCKTNLHMLSIGCNIGKYIGVSFECHLHRQIVKRFGDYVKFSPRTDEQNNCLFFHIVDLFAMTGKFSSRHKVHCSISRRGNFIARINWTNEMCWDKKNQMEILSIMKYLKDLFYNLA